MTADLDEHLDRRVSVHRLAKIGLPAALIRIAAVPLLMLAMTVALAVPMSTKRT